MMSGSSTTNAWDDDEDFGVEDSSLLEQGGSIAQEGNDTNEKAYAKKASFCSCFTIGYYES